MTDAELHSTLADPPEATEPPCKCCGLEPAEPGDPDGYCTDCSIECTDD